MMEMDRISKWSKKYPLYCPKRLVSQQAAMQERLAQEFIALERLENAVKQIMGESALPTWHNIPYLNFARQLYGLRRRYQGKALKREIAIRMMMAQKKLLKKRLLVKIRDTVLSMPMPNQKGWVKVMCLLIRGILAKDSGNDGWVLNKPLKVMLNEIYDYD